MTTSINTGKLMVVDSSTAMLHVLKNFTGKHGYDADHFADPADACDRLDQRFQDFSSDYRAVVLGWPEGRLNLIQPFVQKLSTTDHDALPLILITQEMNADIKALVKRRPKTRAFLWSEYQQIAEVIDLSAKPQQRRPAEKTAIANTVVSNRHTVQSTTHQPTAASRAIDQARTTSHSAMHATASPTMHTASVARVCSVLLVDTSPSICESLREKLEFAGYQVSVASTSAEAKTHLAERAFDVVVTDFFLQGESGETLCHHLNASAQYKSLCVVLTAKYSDSIVKRSLAAGAAACLYKNESTELLSARLDALTRTLKRQSLLQSSEVPAEPARVAGPSEGQTASLHTTTRTELQPVSPALSETGRRGIVKLVTRKPAENAPAFESVTDHKATVMSGPVTRDQKGNAGQRDTARSKSRQGGNDNSAGRKSSTNKSNKPKSDTGASNTSLINTGANMNKNNANMPFVVKSLLTAPGTEAQANRAEITPDKIVQPQNHQDKAGSKEAGLVEDEATASAKPPAGLAAGETRKSATEERVKRPSAKVPEATEPETKVSEAKVRVPIEQLIKQLQDRKSSAHSSLLMLDIQILAATGDRMALSDSEPMQRLVSGALLKLYPKQNAQACTDNGKFVLLLTTAKFQDALVLTRKILQLIPKMVPYLNNMSLVAHAGVIHINRDEVIDPSDLIKRGEAACQKARQDGKDNAALVLPNNQYLSASTPPTNTRTDRVSSKGDAGADHKASLRDETAKPKTGISVSGKSEKERPQTTA